MKLEKLEVSALLGLQARNRELLFMEQNIKQQIEDLNSESKEFFIDIEKRLKLAPDTLDMFDVDTTTGELIPKEDFEEPSPAVSTATTNPANGVTSTNVVSMLTNSAVDAKLTT